MLTHPVIDPTAHTVPLDLFGVVAFVALFGVVAALVRLRPAYGIVALIVCVPFSFTHDVGATTITSSKVALVAAIAGLALRRTGIAALRGPAARVLLVAGLAVSFATALSIAQATYRGAAVRETLKALEYVALFATVVVAARADIGLRGVPRAICGTVIAVAALALLEELTGAPSGMWFHDRPIPRIAGPLEGPNQLAGYLGIALTFAVACIALRARERLARIALALGVAAEVLTISRAGLAAALAGLAVVVVAAPRRPALRDYLIVGASGLVGLGIVGAWGFGVAHSSSAALTLVGHFSTLAESKNAGSVGTRSELWHAAYALWRAHPLLGIGAGNFERELGLVGFPRLHTHANSLYLQALVEGGIPLALATVALVIASIAVFARRPHDDPYVLAAFGASVGFALHQTADLLVFYPKVGDLWWLVLALGAARRDAASASRNA
ncbi:MAG: hypothetical protein NVSMB19_02370 [Vulcanimicrobiaceae bacterium]